MSSIGSAGAQALWVVSRDSTPTPSNGATPQKDGVVPSASRGIMNTTRPPAEPRSLQDVPVKAIHAVGETLARWLPRQGSAEVVKGWTDQEWNIASWLAYWQSAVPWVLSRAADDGVHIGPEIRARLEDVNGLMRARTERLLAEAAEAIEAMSDRDIAVIPLKGVVISQRYFRDPLSRPMMDIDLLISASDNQEAGEVLQSIGYRLNTRQSTASDWWRGTQQPEVWSPDHVRPIDLHVKAERDKGRLGLDIDELMWERSRKENLLGLADVRVPQPVGLFIHTALRASRGLVAGEAKLSHLRDLEAIGGHFEDADWSDIVEITDRVTRRHLLPSVELLARYAPGVVPNHALEAFEASAGRRMRKWLARTGYGRASPSSYRTKFAPLGPVRLFRLVKGPREHLGLLFPPRELVLRSHPWARTPLWPLAYIQRRLRPVWSVVSGLVKNRR